MSVASCVPLALSRRKQDHDAIHHGTYTHAIAGEKIVPACVASEEQKDHEDPRGPEDVGEQCACKKLQCNIDRENLISINL